MCGIAGLLELNSSVPLERLSELTRQMGSRLSHRGPDGGGEWVDAEAGIGLAHRRLSIIELSSAGRQPMISASGRYVLTYNGEVYNFRDLRKDLEANGATFRGNSDTEVLLEAIAAWGLDNTLSRLIGMFAFALWDRQERQLSLVRDRLGIKPLYWGKQGTRIWFASELKSFFADDTFVPEIDRSALSGLVGFNYIPSKQTIFSQVHHVEPGGSIRIRSDGHVESKCYWDLMRIAVDGQETARADNPEAAIEAVEPLLQDAVKRRMVADVPIGVFLSGGVDSSTVAALMQQSSNTPIKTLTIGFLDKSFDEGIHAREIATHLGSDHHDMTIGDREALDVVPKLAQMFCEPFADSSQIPTYLVSALARQHVTVALSGDGGDEVFGGYNRYLAGAAYWPRIARVPGAIRRTAGYALSALPSLGVDRITALLPAGIRPYQPGGTAAKIGRLLTSDDLDDFYGKVVRLQFDVGQTVIGGAEPDNAERWFAAAASLADPVARMQAADMVGYLPGDILTKVDRASMAVGLETRVPLLDHRVVETMWQYPTSLKVRNGRTKWILREVLRRHVPERLTDRPKRGFAVPLADWLRGPLRDWAEALLSPSAIRETGLFEERPVRDIWATHLNRKRDTHYALWSILMAQDWHMKWMKGTPPAPMD